MAGTTRSDQLEAQVQTGLNAVKVLGIAGCSLFYAWFLFACFRLSTLATIPSEDTLRLLPFCSFFLGQALYTSVLRQRGSNVERQRPTRLHVFAFVALSLMMLANLIPFSQIAIGLAVSCLCSCLSGISSVYFFFAWDNFIGRSKVKTYLHFQAISLCFGNILFLLAGLLLTVPLQAVFFALLLVLSAMVLLFVSKPSEARLREYLERTEEEAPEADSPKLTLDHRIRALQSLFGVFLGIAWIYLIHLFDLQIPWTFLVATVALLVATSLMPRNASIHDKHITLFVRTTVCVLVFCFLGVAACPLSVGAGFLVVACAYWQLFWMVDSSILMRHAFKNDFSITQHLAIGRVGTITGFFVGTVLCFALFLILDESALIRSVSLILVAGIVLAAMILIPFGKRVSPYATNEAEHVEADELIYQLNATNASCRSLAERFDLSERELEILMLIVKGKSNPTIAKSLYISQNTAKTHVYNIYKKLGIHSRQEALDLVERESGNPSQIDVQG